MNLKWKERERERERDGADAYPRCLSVFPDADAAARKKNKKTSPVDDD